LLSGLSWGAASYLFFAFDSRPRPVFLAFVIEGMAAGAVTTLSAQKWAAIDFIVPRSILPLFYRLTQANHDFGTGYSSLAYLKRFDIDPLKIDQSFIKNLESDSSDLARSEAIVVMAHKLGFRVIAEGVETEGQRKILEQMGCDYAQGYLFSRPVPAEAFEELLRSWPHSTKSLNLATGA